VVAVNSATAVAAEFTAAASTVAPSKSDSGCGCHVLRGGSTRNWTLALLFMALLRMRKTSDRKGTPCKGPQASGTGQRH
jgi:hypothetical protein